ncbi:uncharacterized protein PV07_06875 [Cladophialophora immunda]|uniref:Amine oxidase n=1 Tax=Cladophialophora immunda TaxID=569365 RepID=A0A0D2C9I1_9EURO|nr:uncharacterized protein PV07_06875 [Cladophialophora immunda]KIW27100.1 hypothetical protein PV07_06875 [Cladophialophora immunda]OQU99656.1 hypothetical protein CLAIMM_05262 isoform 1 [Cladophialophora immunda]
MSQQVYDVVIVGAGLSGLQAALTVHHEHLSYVVLEARDRVGGKTLTLRSSEGAVKSDLGAAWINDSNQSRMWELANDLGLHTYVQNTQGDVVVQDFDGSLVKFPYGDVPKYPSGNDTESCISIRDLVENISTTQTPSIFSAGPHREQLDSISFETFLRRAKVTDKAFATAQVWTHAMLGVDPAEVSALYFLEYCAAGGGLMTMRSDCKDGGQYLRIREGTAAFAEGMAQKLKPGSIKLACPVGGIDQQQDKTVLVSTRGPSPQVYRARKVILSIPTPVYKTVKFSPSLPAAKSAVANHTRYGFYTKYIVRFSRPFWTERNLCGLGQSFVGPVSVFRDTSLGDEACMTCFVGGKFGRKWAAQDAERKKASVLKQIGAIFAEGRDIRPLFVEAYESPWMDEEFSGWGCPCPAMPPGVLADGWEALCASFGNIHFVGTELSTVWRGYMEGAIRSGESGAMQAIAELKAGASQNAKL